MGQGHLGHTCSLPSKIKPLQSSVCKTLFLTHKPGKKHIADIKKYMPFPCKGKQLCIHLSSGRTGHYPALQAWADPTVSRNRNHLPVNQKLALTTQHTHTKSNLHENKLLRKWILHHHIFLLHCNLRWSKTHLHLHTHTHTHTHSLSLSSSILHQIFMHFKPPIAKKKDLK